jgi:hypothetical protein
MKLRSKSRKRMGKISGRRAVRINFVKWLTEIKVKAVSYSLTLFYSVRLFC